MRVIKSICSGINLVSEWSAKAAMWIGLLLIIVITYDVIMRYVFNAPTLWAYDVSYMLLATFAAIGFAYLHQQGGNVRVDVIYNRFPLRGRLVIDIVFTLIFFFPLYYTLTTIFFKDAWQAFQINETATETPFFPITWPYKTMITLGFGLLFLQGIAGFVRDVVTLIKSGKET